jgi:hypothetical protein
VLKCESWHTEDGTSAVPWELQRLIGPDGGQPQPPYPAYQLRAYDETGAVISSTLFTSDEICPQCQAEESRYSTNTLAIALDDSQHSDDFKAFARRHWGTDWQQEAIRRRE